MRISPLTNIYLILVVLSIYLPIMSNHCWGPPRHGWLNKQYKIAGLNKQNKWGILSSDFHLYFVSEHIRNISIYHKYDQL